MTTPEQGAGSGAGQHFAQEHRSPRIPLLCPRCGHEQQVVPGGPGRAVKVVHVGTGQEACEPADLATAPEDGI
ncbi:hypothetical protein OH807_10970 [Kitasatospora sp. NBC_01560]|uniref:hypothetical protein n=1 Tax=Kitasatospora sp. NBC_01560 TaxID=2975965 RepID=UPI0038672335